MNTDYGAKGPAGGGRLALGGLGLLVWAALHVNDLRDWVIEAIRLVNCEGAE